MRARRKRGAQGMAEAGKRQIQVWCSPQVYAAISERAAKLELCVSTYVRLTALIAAERPEAEFERSIYHRARNREA